MTGRPTDHMEPSAKKRGNERQLTKDDASDDEGEVRAVLVGTAVRGCFGTGAVNRQSGGTVELTPDKVVA